MNTQIKTTNNKEKNNIFDIYFIAIGIVLFSITLITLINIINN